MAWIPAKTDWTADDFYNYSDLNRVENNTDYIKSALQSLGYTPILSSINTARTKASIDYYDDINRVESNIKALADASYEPLSWLTPELDWISVYKVFDYEDANRLESNLVNLKAMVENISEEIRYCGTYYCGDEFGDMLSDWGLM